MGVFAGTFRIMSSYATKMIMTESVELVKEKEQFKVIFKEENILEFDAFITGPEDSVYRHKLLKLRFHVPERYPMVPPKVTFIQHTGGRIHPNLYVEGKVCLSILGTWPGDPWSASFNIYTILASIRGLLDFEPYRHEPGSEDDPNYNKFVQFVTWRALLLDHVDRETEQPSKDFINEFLREHATGIIEDIEAEKELNKDVPYMSNPYSEWVFKPDYDRLLREMKGVIAAANAAADAAPDAATDAAADAAANA
ncbi:putative ubiquitin-conjugating enzyme E2 Z-like [Rosellinia necatrix]|uniref:Putative ubiquitin-conjugating enzyme E2 Z-like n=1 Tax=Rosellinia necatrix TaxID=77044 RepID=A0A1W2TBT9_ROSNE|nr:putative ubiquitin-conjugating enzyme E2 Z-like [Rosellinia necatrix]